MKKLRFGKELGIILINKMLEKHGKTYEDVKDEPLWYDKYTWTLAEEYEYMNWFVDYIYRNVTPRMSKKQIRREYSFFTLGWGLKIEQ